ncbi:hypothetical protein DOJK_01814 [Patescibacteria group bacterium]|nr:hypothetical protein DOJK_01814 [Patescibacteria group bacterium]
MQATHWLMNKKVFDMRITKILKVFKWVAIFIGSIILLVTTCVAIFIWQRPWMPFMDDGPFHGKIVTQIPNEKPTQIFPINKFTLEVYSPISNNEAPIVLLREGNNKVKWAIYAEAYEKTHVSSLKFKEYRTIFDITIRGTVTWTYGNEVMWWYIDRNGTLKEYWYSW